MALEAIPTLYRGTKFRSRLEARWAIFFTHMRLKYVYEPEGFDLGDLTYVPDFWLPHFHCFAEVKPTWEHFLGEPLEKCRRLSIAKELPVLLLDGLPDWRCYNVMTGHGVYLPGVGALVTYAIAPGSESDIVSVLQKDKNYSAAVNSARGRRF